jgi:protoheme IX farnesyltransferase
MPIVRELSDTAHEPILAGADASIVLSRPLARVPVVSDYWRTTKPDVTSLIAVTTAVGFYLGTADAASGFSLIALLNVLLGTVLVASGAAALNQWMEYPFDARMRRTLRRPIAAGRIDPNHALTFGVFLSLAGLAYLLLAAGELPSLLALATLAGYLCCYTPLKRITPLCTLVGAIPGAAPPLIGWAAARGHLDPQAWVLFLIVFLWQFPHFMSIAWMYRDDYDRAGYLVLPERRSRVRFVTLQTLLPIISLLPVTLLPLFAGAPRWHYSIAALALGIGFLYFGARFTRRRSGSSARRLLLASVIYLPALLAMITLLA